MTGLGVFAAMFIVLASLAPVYLENYRLQQYLREVTRTPSTPDETVKTEVIARVHQLGLPVVPEDIAITRPNGKLRLEVKYKVQMHLTLYQVDLHFHPVSQGR